MNWVKCSTFALGKAFFFTKRFLSSCNAQNFATRLWFPQGICNLSQLGMEKGQHSFISTVLCFLTKRNQQLRPKGCSDFRCL